MVSVQLVGLISMLATGHCSYFYDKDFIVAREFTDQGQCNQADEDPTTPFFDFLHKGDADEKARRLGPTDDKKKASLDSLINYNYYVEDACILTTITYTMAEPQFLELKDISDGGDCSLYDMVELTPEECEQRVGTTVKIGDQSSMKEHILPGVYGGTGTWSDPDESCGCYVGLDSNNLQKLYFNRYVVTGLCKRPGVAYHTPNGKKTQKKICKKVNEHGDRYAKMGCFQEKKKGGVHVDVFEKDDTKGPCAGNVIGSIRHDDCTPREEPFATYIKFTCGYRSPAVHLQSYSQEGCLDATMTRDAVWPLGVCMTSWSPNYFDVGNPNKSDKAGKDTRDFGNNMFVSYKPLRFSSKTAMTSTATLEQYQENIETCLMMMTDKDYAKVGTKAKAKKFTLDCAAQQCSDKSYTFMGDDKVYLKLVPNQGSCMPPPPYSVPIMSPPGFSGTTPAPITLATTTSTTRATQLTTTQAQCQNKCGRDDTFGWLRKCTWNTCAGCPECVEHCQSTCYSEEKYSWRKKCTMDVCKYCSRCHQCHSSCTPARGDQTWWMCKKPWCKNCEACVRDYYSVNPKEKAELSRMGSPSNGMIIAITISGLMVCLGLRLVRARTRAPNEGAYDAENME